MGYMIRFRRNDDVDDYKRAGKMAKNGLAMIMDAIDHNDLRSAQEGMEMAWKGVKTMCKISDEMEEQYSERRNDNFHDRDEWGQRHDRRGFNYRNNDDWNQRDDEMMERRMRDSRGRFM